MRVAWLEKTSNTKEELRILIPTPRAPDLTKQRHGIGHQEVANKSLDYFWTQAEAESCDGGL